MPLWLQAALLASAFDVTLSVIGGVAILLGLRRRQRARGEAGPRRFAPIESRPCPLCGEAIPPAAPSCPHCGEALTRVIRRELRGMDERRIAWRCANLECTQVNYRLPDDREVECDRCGTLHEVGPLPEPLSA